MSNRMFGRGCWLSVCIAAVTILAGSAWAQPTIDYPRGEVNNQKNPHPITYGWQGDVPEPVTEPGPYYYHFYYTGTVTGDARVTPDSVIQRIPVPDSEWPSYYMNMVTALVFHYAVNTMNSKAVGAYEGKRHINVGSLPYVPGQTQSNQAPVVPGVGQQEDPYATGTTDANDPYGYADDPYTDTAAEEPMLDDTGEDNVVSLPSVYNADYAAAHWTFYYDQLVLWQYYCVRNLLGEDDFLLEEEVATDEAVQSRATGTLVGQAARQPTVTRTAEEIEAMRLELDPVNDYASNFVPGKTPLGQKLRQDLEVKAARHEEYVYKQYIGMINRIEAREGNQKRYEDWLEAKRQQIFNFAEEWRKVENGEVMFLDDRLFLVTKEPLTGGPLEATNVVVREQLTPQDLLNDDGTLVAPTEN